MELGKTISICPECRKRVDAKIVSKENGVFIVKSCPEHGEQTEILEEDSKYHLRKKEFDKPGTKTCFQTKVDKQCPFDCGLCPEHKQHTCNALIDITNDCDLKCPVCYANSGKKKHLDIKTIEKMMDFFQKCENNNAEILQISGGEPTTHPKILEIIRLAKSKNFRYVMLNTNGLRLAEDENFARELAKFRGRFEIYLQFDGFAPETYQELRGKDISQIKLKAIDNLLKYKIPVTLVATIKKGLNDSEIGKIIEFAINKEGIRGINFQPICYSGRISHKDKEDRITLSGIINQIEKQTNSAIKASDVVPLPCDVHRVAVCYLAKTKKGFLPLTRHLNVKSYLPVIDNTLAFDADKILEKAKSAFCCSFLASIFIKDLKNLIPENYSSLSNEQKSEHWDKSSFRITITSFLDYYNFDLESMQKECVHFITPDLKRIPFSAYNMFHRERYLS